jgi:uncharacterized membrane protein
MSVDDAAWLAAVVAAVANGVMAGLFFAFSTSVMPGLRRLPPVDGMAAMRRINAAILNPLFLLLFVGSAVVNVAVLATAPFGDPDTAVWRVAGAAIYLVGAIGVTAVVNVPLNKALLAVAPDSAEGATLWARYLLRWTSFNHLRAAASVLSTTLLVVASGR